MTPIRSALAIIAITVLPAAASAGEWGSRSLGERLVERNCTWCHGPSAQGFATAPRLAGQTKPYIEKQLLNFKIHRRDNPKSQQYMWGAASLVNQASAQEMADYLASLEPEAARDGDQSLTETGRVLYRDGSQSSNIPSCVVCHGPEGQGAGAIPRIGGLSHRYLKRMLEQWGEGYHASAMAPMPAVASKLSDDDINALASYLSYVD